MSSPLVLAASPGGTSAQSGMGPQMMQPGGAGMAQMPMMQQRMNTMQMLMDQMMQNQQQMLQSMPGMRGGQ